MDDGTIVVTGIIGLYNNNKKSVIYISKNPNLTLYYNPNLTLNPDFVKLKLIITV